MTDSQRQTYLKIGAIGLVALLLLDYIVITPAMAAWSAQSDRIDALRQKVQRGQQLLDRQDSIRQHWAQMLHANLSTEDSAAENTAYQAIFRWAHASGISLPSLSPSWPDSKDQDYQTLEYRASATGSQAQLGRFIYEMETDTVPVNLIDYEITSREERGQELQMTARFSFLRMNTSDKETP
jgi:hypothetical protein